jgi:ribosomal protein L32
MSGPLDTAASVSAVVSAFHGGADLVSQIRKRSKRRKGEQALKEKLLQESLETGELQISQRYTSHYEELGQRFKTGDGKAVVAPQLHDER